MKVFRTVEALREFRIECFKMGKSVGLVPTMGALHQGHISLVEQSKKACEVTVVSIFVNPLQFNNSNDLINYPKTIEQDSLLLSAAGVEVLFLPNENEMYPEAPTITLNFGTLETVMEGAYRPGHFSGVGIIVAKLFSLVQPTKAFFGQKDLQQFLVIQQLVKELSFPIELICCPIIRDEDGLAMSSRNVRLTKKNRPLAGNLFSVLTFAKDNFQNLGIEKTKQEVVARLKLIEEIKLEYFEMVDGVNLNNLSNFPSERPIAICIAAYLDGVRLIDNELVN